MSANAVVEWTVVVGLAALAPVLTPGPIAAALVWTLLLAWVVLEPASRAWRVGLTFLVLFGVLTTLTFLGGDLRPMRQWRPSRSLRAPEVEPPLPGYGARCAEAGRLALTLGLPWVAVVWFFGLAGAASVDDGSVGED